MVDLGSSAEIVDGSCGVQFPASAMGLGRLETVGWVPINFAGWRAGNWVVVEEVACVEVAE